MILAPKYCARMAELGTDLMGYRSSKSFLSGKNEDDPSGGGSKDGDDGDDTGLL